MRLATSILPAPSSLTDLGRMRRAILDVRRTSCSMLNHALGQEGGSGGAPWWRWQARPCSGFHPRCRRWPPRGHHRSRCRGRAAARWRSTRPGPWRPAGPSRPPTAPRTSKCAPARTARPGRRRTWARVATRRAPGTASSWRSPRPARRSRCGETGRARPAAPSWRRPCIRPAAAGARRSPSAPVWAWPSPTAGWSSAQMGPATSSPAGPRTPGMLPTRFSRLAAAAGSRPRRCRSKAAWARRMP